jgi:hypothetical protein
VSSQAERGICFFILVSCRESRPATGRQLYRRRLRPNIGPYSLARQLPPSRHTPGPSSPAPAPTTCKSRAPSQRESVSTPDTPPQFPTLAPTAAAHTIPKPAPNEPLQTRSERLPLKTSRPKRAIESLAPSSRMASPRQKPAFETSSTTRRPSTARSRSPAKIPPQY